MSTEGKERIPYSPPEGKRFEVSRDSITKERVHALREIYAELQEELPYDVGLSLYGSLSKGKELSEEDAGKADIDLFVFADRDQLVDSYEAITVNNPQVKEHYEEYRKKYPGVTNIEYEAKRSAMRKHMHETVLARIESKTNTMDHPLSDIHYGSYTLEVESWEKDPKKFDSFMSSAMDPFEMDQSMGGLPHMFHLNVGGMKKFRGAFLEALSKKPKQYRDKMWQRISASTLELEKGREPDREIKFPATFEEAQRTYGTPKN